MAVALLTVVAAVPVQAAISFDGENSEWWFDTENWTESDAFRKAHAQARAPEGTYLGHPEFEGFEVVL